MYSETLPLDGYINFSELQRKMRCDILTGETLSRTDFDICPAECFVLIFKIQNGIIFANIVRP